MSKLIDRIPKDMTGEIRIKHTKTTGESVVILSNDEPRPLRAKESSSRQTDHGYDPAQQGIIIDDILDSRINVWIMMMIDIQFQFWCLENA